MVQKKINKLLAFSALYSSLLIGDIKAAEIMTNMVQMQAMDKITGRVSKIDVPVNSEVIFGSFSIVVRNCATRPPEETPENYAFVDVVDNYNTDKPVNIFKGWMFSSSPALSAIEHPIYDIWVLKCYDGKVDPKNLLSTEQLQKRDEITKFIPSENKFNKDISPTEVIEQETPQTSKELIEPPLDLPTPPVVADEQEVAPQPIEYGAPKSLLNLDATKPLTAPTTAENIETNEPNIISPSIDDENTLDNVVKQLQQNENSATVELEPLVIESPAAPVEQLLDNEINAQEEPSAPLTVQPDDTEIVTENLIIEENANPSDDEQNQLIHFDEEAEEDGFEINAEALAN